MLKTGKRLSLKVQLLSLLSILFLAGILGTPVQATEKSDDDGNIEETETGVVQPLAFIENGMITGDGVRLRANPNTNATILELMYWGETVQIDLSKSTMTFYYVKRNKTGMTGYVSRDYVSILQIVR